MNDKTRLVYRGFTELSATERSELVKAVNEFIEADPAKRVAINESLGNTVSKMDLGPMGGTCPCCGR